MAGAPELGELRGLLAKLKDEAQAVRAHPRESFQDALNIEDALNMR